MPTPAEHIQRLESLCDFIAGLEGKAIRITESLTHDPGRADDRHCTTTSCLEFTVVTVNWTISGGNVELNGPGHTCYAISTSCISAVQVNPGMAVVTESFDGRAERRSQIKAVG